MKLRFSNGKDFAITFDANDEASFAEQGMSALRSFRIATERRVHRGEIHKTVSWFDSAFLGLYDENHRQWYHPGEIKALESGLSFFEPRPVVAPRNEAEDIEAKHREDEFWIAANASRIWGWCYDCWRWGQALNLQIMQICDRLDKPD